MNSTAIGAALKCTGKTLAVAVFSFIFALTVFLLFKPSEMPHQFGIIVLPTLAAFPFISAWVIVRRTKSHVSFGGEFPENAVGGMAIGFAITFCIATAFAGQAEGAPDNPFGAAAPFLILLAMALGGFLSLVGLKKDRSLLLLFLAPLVAIGTFAFLVATASDPETTVSNRGHIEKSQ